MKKTIFSILLSIIIFYAMIHPSCSVDDAHLHNVCRNTVNPSYCLKVLKSDPRTASSDNHGLARISLDLALSKASTILTHIQALSRHTGEPKLKTRLKSCSDYYFSTTSELRMARRSLDLKDYFGVANGAASAMEHSESCEDEFEAGPPTMPGIKAMNNDMENLCSVLYEVAGSTA